MVIEKTRRGLDIIRFEDAYGKVCSIQESSAAFNPYIWLGIEDANPQILAYDAKRLGIPTDAVNGWIPYDVPPEVKLSTRMHLNIEQVKEIIPILQKFVDTGSIV